MKREEKTFLDKILLFSLVGIVIVLPLQVTKQLFPVHILGSNFPVLELSRVLMALGFLVLLVRAVHQKALVIPRDALALVLYGLVGLSAVSALNYFSSPGLREVVRYGFYLAFFMLTVNTINDRKGLRLIWKCFILSGLLVSLFGIFQYLTGLYLWNSGLDEGTFRRVNAAFWDPNVLATFMGLVILAASAYYSQSKDIKGKIFGAVVTVSSLAALFYTFSRGGLTSFVASILALSIALPKYAKNLFLYLALVGVFALLVLTTPDVGSRLTDIYEVARDSVSGLRSLGDSGRTGEEVDGAESLFVKEGLELSGEDQEVCLAGWEMRPSARYESIVTNVVSLLPLNKDRDAAVRAGIYMAIDNPVFGVGLGNFQEKYLGEYCHLIGHKRSVTGGNPITRSHSSFITVAAEMGLIGVVWFGIFVFVFFWLLWRILRQRSDLNAFVSAIGAGMLLLLLHTQIRGGLLSDPYFWLLNGLLVSVARFKDAPFVGSRS